MNNKKISTNVTDLVKICRGNIFCDSRMIAEKFGKDHKNVLQKIDKLKAECLEIEHDFKKKTRVYRGQDFRYYEMGIKGLLQICMNFAGKRYADKRHAIINMIAEKMDGFDKILEALNDFDIGEFPVRYVYAAQDITGRIKIGISNNPDRRLKELNIGNAEDLKLIYVKETLKPCYQDETKLHNKASEYHIRGEWFEPDVKLLLSVTV